MLNGKGEPPNPVVPFCPRLPYISASKLPMHRPIIGISSIWQNNGVTWPCIVGDGGYFALMGLCAVTYRKALLLTHNAFPPSLGPYRETVNASVPLTDLTVSPEGLSN